MRILWLAFLYITETLAQGYGSPWLDVPSPQITPFKRPVDVMTDVINELGIRVLQEYGETRNAGNIAFSPTGIGFVLAALYEGSAGPGNEQILNVLGLPRDKDITRIGLRDIHRRLRSYLSPDGFLGGLILNRENTKLRPEYEEVLKFLGFDLSSGDKGANTTDSSTSIPETTLSDQIPSNETLPLTTTMTSTSEDSTTTIPEVTVASRFTDTATMNTQIPEEVPKPTTIIPNNEITTMNYNPEETTTFKNDDDETETVNVEEIPTTRVPSTTPIPTTTESATTVTQISSRLTEISSEMNTVEKTTQPISPTTMETMNGVTSPVTETMETTLTSAEETSETTKPGNTTLEPEDSVSNEITTTMISKTTLRPQDEQDEESDVEILDSSEIESKMQTTSSKPDESPEELTTVTSLNEVTTESTAIILDPTTVDPANDAETIANVNTVEPSESRQARRMGIRDSVVKTLLEGKSKGKKNVEDKDEGKNRGTRSPRGYFSSFSDFPSFPTYPDFPGFPEETSWIRKVGGWRLHLPKTDGGSLDSSAELLFLVNGEDAMIVSAATYTVVLPFAFLPALQALALEFPLDDPRYNILLLLPTDRDGTRRLAKDLGNVSLRELRKELQPAWVRAMIPSFMLKGFVTLTPFLQRLGIRDVFEPREANLSPMTEDEGVYARDVQQSIGVNIRNYMKPDRTHSRNGLFERAGPVSFVAEHPFLFFIIDAETGVSLIAGRIENPLNSRIL